MFSLALLFRNIQHFSLMINDFHLLKFQTFLKNTHCLKINILTLIRSEGVTWGLGGGEVIWLCKTLHPEIRIWNLGVLKKQKFINIALVVLKCLKWFNLPPSP